MLDDEQLTRRTLQAKSMLRRRKLRGVRAQLIELSEAEYLSGLAECDRRGIQTRGAWFTAGDGMSGLEVETANRIAPGYELPQSTPPTERPSRSRKALKPPPAPAAALFDLLERSVAAAVNGNGSNGSSSNGKH